MTCHLDIESTSSQICAQTSGSGSQAKDGVQTFLPNFQEGSDPVNCARILLLASFSAAFPSTLTSLASVLRKCGLLFHPWLPGDPTRYVLFYFILSTGSQPFHVLLREPEGAILAVAAAAAKSLQSCPTLCGPHRLQPTRLRHPWDSPGRNTGVGCHFLLQCMKMKSESEVA